MIVSASLALAWATGVPRWDRIDPGLIAGMQAGRPQAVFVMLDGQFLPPKTFDAWAEKNIEGDRIELRKEVVKELKERATDVPKIAQELLGDATDFRTVWLVKGFGAVLEPGQVEAVSKDDRVMYVYPVNALPPKVSTGKTQSKSGFGGTGASPDRIPWNVEKIGVEKAREEFNLNGYGSVVAMVESGVDYLRPELYGSVWRNAGEVENNGKDDDGNGFVDDLFGYDFVRSSPDVLGPEGRGRNHGTMTTGIIVGSTRPTMIGIAPAARFMVVPAGGTFNIMLGLQYAIENGADIVNMSFSVPNLGHARGLWRLASEHATAAGLVLVSGVGNFQQTEKVPEQIRIPEGIPCVIGAGGVDQELKVPPFCSLGPVEWSQVKFYEDYPMPNGLIKPDVCGFPGAGYPILDVDKPEGGLLDPNDRVRGNSFSGPHISGVVALMFQANKSLTAMKVKEVLEATATDIDPPGKDNRTGAGLVNGYLAIKEAMRLKG